MDQAVAGDALWAEMGAFWDTAAHICDAAVKSAAETFASRAFSESQLKTAEYSIGDPVWILARSYR